MFDKAGCCFFIGVVKKMWVGRKLKAGAAKMCLFVNASGYNLLGQQRLS